MPSLTPYLTPRIPRCRYADAMGSKAANGYDSFCRQDLIGADYGLLDCATAEPLPDYYTALLWAKTMGRTAFAVDAAGGGGRADGRGAAATVRLYAHCTAAAESAGGAAAGSLTVLAINLANEGATLRLSSVGDVARAYVLEGDADARASLTGVGGLLGTGAKLNGSPLRAAADGTPPELTPATDLGREVTLPPTSLAWLVVPGAARKECGGQS